MDDIRESIKELQYYKETFSNHGNLSSVAYVSGSSINCMTLQLVVCQRFRIMIAPY
uniref:Uncharacterized protein n=1 Tax=Arundo donax TaxID=35708 RepID=A0A0A9EIC1_ARUDO